MEFQNTFVVQAPADQVWATLLDVERIAPCMPGASVLEQTGEDAYKVAVKVKVGPMTMNYMGDIEILERDADTHRATMRSRGARRAGALRGQAGSHVQESAHVLVRARRTGAGRRPQARRGAAPPGPRHRARTGHIGGRGEPAGRSDRTLGGAGPAAGSARGWSARVGAVRPGRDGGTAAQPVTPRPIRPSKLAPRPEGGLRA